MRMVRSCASATSGVAQNLSIAIKKLVVETAKTTETLLQGSEVVFQTSG